MEMSEKGKSGLKVFLLRLHRNVYVKVFPDFIEELNREIDGPVLDIWCVDGSPLRGSSLAEGFRHAAVSAKGKIEGNFKSGSFDCVIAPDLLEHFSKEEGLGLLKAMETIARKKVIVLTPNGFLPQAAEAGRPWQEHKSGWTVEEMRGLGYRVIGLNGLKSLRGEEAKVRRRPKFLWWFFSDLTQLFVRSRPEKAYQILCVKEK